MAKLTDEQLADLREKAMAATPGEWHYNMFVLKRWEHRIYMLRQHHQWYVADILEKCLQDIIDLQETEEVFEETRGDMWGYATEDGRWAIELINPQQGVSPPVFLAKGKESTYDLAISMMKWVCEEVNNKL